MGESLKDDLEEKRDMVTSLTDVMDKITQENQHLRAREAQLQVNAIDGLRQQNSPLMCSIEPRLSLFISMMRQVKWFDV